MNCLSKEELIDYLFKEDRPARAAAEAHFLSCAGCRAKMETLRQVKTAAASVPPAPVSGDFTGRLMRGLKKREIAPAGTDLPAFFRRLYRPAWGYGLAAFAAASCFGALFLTVPRAPRPAPAEALYFSDGPATVNTEFSVPGKGPGGNRAGFVYTDACATARCGIL